MRKGFTIIELLVVVAIIGLLLAILLPAIGKARETAQGTQSLSNLRSIGQACGIYASEFQDRQWTAISEDVGDATRYPDAYASSSSYTSKRRGAQLVLGMNSLKEPTGFLVPFKETDSTVGNPSPNNWPAYFPCSFDDKNANFGSWRLVNARSFNKYVSGKFYDSTFYAPKDRITLGQLDAVRSVVSEARGSNQNAEIPEGDYFGKLEQTVLSSYCWSPAAMWSPDVLPSKGTKRFVDPQTLPNGLKAPSVSQVRFNELKTRCLEHSWLQNNPTSGTMNGSKKISGQSAGVANPDALRKMLGKDEIPQPWFFNQAINSSPNCLFFDGHVGQLGVQDAIDSNSRIALKSASKTVGTFAQGAIGKLSNGYFYGQYDPMVGDDKPSFHVLTIDGGLGRDTIGEK